MVLKSKENNRTSREVGIVIFFYDAGSRKVLTDFIEDADIAPLQYDGYNVYKYLDGRLLDDPLPKGDLLTKALHYLKNAWTPVMAYRNDGRYCIDNSIAERSIRTLTIERKLNGFSQSSWC